MPPKKSKPVPQEILNTGKARLQLPDGTQLHPGANRVKAATLRLVQSCEITRAWLARGIIQIRNQVPAAGSVTYDLSLGLPASLLGLDLETVRTCIEMCCSKDQLFRWLEGAGDPEIRQLLVERGYEVATALAAKEEAGAAN